MKRFIIYCSILLSCSLWAENPTQLERRAAIDVGSGSTKVAIADVDIAENRIVEILFEEAFPVPYQAALATSYDGAFDSEIRELGLTTFREIRQISDDFQVQKIAAVATAAFREAANGEWFARQVEQETGIPLQIISQHEEGTIAFLSGVAACDIDPQNLIVWDIGTGSFQLTTLTDRNEYSVFMGGIGSIPFRNYIIDTVQGRDSSEEPTPNPMSEEDVEEADRYARALARKAYPIIKEKIKNPDGVVVGIGRLFSNSIGPMGQDGVIVRSDLRSFINGAVGLTDDQMGNPYANVDVSNAILVLAFMKALHIHEIHIVESKSTNGLLIYAPAPSLEVSEPDHLATA